MERDIIFWVLFGLLILYIVLKGVGVIQSPEWIEISPFALVALLILKIRGDIKEDINSAIETTTSPIKELINENRKLINRIDNRLSKQEGIIEAILHKGKDNLTS